MVRLLVADAQCIARMGLRMLCSDLGGFTVAGESTNGEETLEVLAGGIFDMVVVDPHMPTVNGRRSSLDNGINLIDSIRTRHADLPILVFTGNRDLHTVKRVLNRGVQGLLAKDSDRKVLTAALQKVSAGENFISPNIAMEMMFESRVERDALTGRLSSRELQIMRLLCRGMSINAIADALLISSRTVSTYKARLMRKMNFRSNAEMFRYAVESGMIESKFAALGVSAGRSGAALPIADCRLPMPQQKCGRKEGGFCRECDGCEHSPRRAASAVGEASRGGDGLGFPNKFFQG